MTPLFNKILKRHIQKDRVSQHTHTTVIAQSYCPISQTWTLTTSPAIHELPPIDYIYFATGVQSDFNTLGMLQTMATKFPIDSHGGLPALNDDLMWKDDIPLFMTGRLATLRLGPGAGNLEGARVGAERVAWAVEDVLSPRRDSLGSVINGKYGDGDEHYRYGAGIGSRFASLAQDES